MKLCIWWATFVLAAVIAGCDYDEYEIELTPRGNRIERKLSAWHVSYRDKEETRTRLSDEKLAALDGLYEKRLTKPDQTVQTFIATFSSRMPKDVGGAGYYLRYESSLGYACVYSERFRGNDDLFSAVERVESAADKLTDILIGWFEAEMGKDRRFAHLKEFIDQQFRRDLKNAGLYPWTLSIAEKPNDELLVRLVHYFAEREYFPPEDIPALLRAIEPFRQHEEEGQGGPSYPAAMARLRRLVADRMGVPAGQPIPESLAFLADAPKAMESLSRYIRTTEEFQQAMAEWRKQVEATPDDKRDEKPAPPEPLNIPSEAAGNLTAFELRLWSREDTVRVRLATPVEPCVTNGEWDHESKRTQWRGDLEDPDKSNMRLPTLFYAAWAVPDEAAQKRHFGEVLVEGQKLLEHCLWHEGLSRQEARQWDAMIDTLRPKNMEVKLRAFRFPGRPPLPTTQPVDFILRAREATTRPATQPAEKD